MPLSWFKGEARPVGYYTTHLKLWMANAKQHFIMRARLIDSVFQNWEKSPLEKLLKLNGLNPSRLGLYSEERTTYHV